MKRICQGVIAICFVTTLVLFSCRNNESGNQSRPSQDTKELNAQYVGRENCRSCHEKEYDLFTGSDHDMAMDSATDITVLGDFDESIFTHHGITSRFYKKDGKFYVNTEGVDGELHDYEVAYVFGISPLQQYLMKFPDGAYQCLPLCWDTRPAEQGGQRWFHIYGDERIPPDDILFWTRTTQNWNYMCSECHSTNLKKAYDHKSRKYHTNWSEIDVSCEACHGPGSQHVSWAEEKEQGRPVDKYIDMGLMIRLKDLRQGTWIFEDETGTAKRTTPRESNTLIEMCARCHARRGIIDEEYVHSRSFLDTHRPSLLEDRLYFPDGQIQDEVYVYASFLQSKMYESGVVCSDCHEAHSTKVFVQGNALCYRCHLADKYGDYEHHFHKQDSEGARCVECHMPERTYMVVDPRRDHSMRIPRPDLTKKLNTPNACNRCHNDKSTDWAIVNYEQWYGDDYKKRRHFGEIFWGGRQYYPEALKELILLADSTGLPVMIRATALSLLSHYSDPSIPSILKRALFNPEPLIRTGALDASEFLSVEDKIDLLTPLLDDSVKLIRMMAARNLAGVGPDLLTKDEIKSRDKSLEEYINSQLINADNPGGYLNLALVYLEQDDYSLAEIYYRKALEVEPAFMVTYINLADLYRMQGRDDDGEQLLRDALIPYPDMADVHHALGLLLVRKGKHEEAIEHIREAAFIDPENPRYAYVYGVALNSMGDPEDAVAFLDDALSRFPYDRNILYTLATIYIDMENFEQATIYSDRLVEYFPFDENYRQLQNYLQSNSN